MAQRQTPTNARFLNLGVLSERERIFIMLCAIVGVSQAEAYRLAFDKSHCSPITLSTNASRLINSQKIQESLWRLKDYFDAGMVKFNENTLKIPNPKFYKN